MVVRCSRSSNNKLLQKTYKLIPVGIIPTSKYLDRAAILVTGLQQTDVKSLFPRGPSLTLRFVVLAALAMAAMNLDHRTSLLEAPRDYLSLAVYPLQLVADLPYATAPNVSDALSSRQNLLSANLALREENLLLMARLEKVEALEEENARIRALLQSSSQLTEQVLIGEILAVDIDPYRHQVRINRGSQHGARKGQALIDASGIVGQVVQSGPVSSTALFITDRDHAVPVQVNRNGLRTIAVGTGDPRRLSLPYLPNNADIRNGDLLVTSGLGERFPPRYPVAVVVGIEPDSGRGFAEIAAEPTATLDRGRHVLLVWRQPAIDQTEIEQATNEEGMDADSGAEQTDEPKTESAAPPAVSADASEEPTP